MDDAGEMTPGPTVLLGSAPFSMLARVAADLRRRDPGCRLWVLALDDAPQAFADRLIPYVDQGGAVANLRDRRRILRDLQSAQPGRVIIPVAGEVFTISNMAVLGCLVGVPISVVDSNLVYRPQQPGPRAVAWHLFKGMVARLPRPEPPTAK